MSAEAQAPAPRQRDVLRYVEAHRASHGHSPTVREIGRELGITSNNGVVAHLKALARKGLVQWVPHRARTLSVTPSGLRWLALLVLVLAGCSNETLGERKAAGGAAWCVSVCERAGMEVFVWSLNECHCRPAPPSCEAAWTRADVGLELLGDCRAALQACTARGGGR